VIRHGSESLEMLMEFQAFHTVQYGHHELAFAKYAGEP